MRFVGSGSEKAWPQWLHESTCMAVHPSRPRSAWLLSTPLALLMALPVGAMEALPGATTPVVADEVWLAQKPPNEEGAIPAEVQAWFEGAKAADSRGDAAEVLRLQKRVVAWLEAHPGAPVVFKARALINLGVFLGNVGQRQEALAPTRDAVGLLRPLEGSQGEARKFLAMALNNLGLHYSNLGRREEALKPTEEAVGIYGELAKSNRAFLPDLASALNNLGLRQLEQGQPEQARSAYEESLKIIRPLAAANPAFQDDLQRTLNNLEELNRKEAIRTGQPVLAATDLSYLPRHDPTTPVKRAVVRLLPTFSGNKSGMGLGTGFVVRREGDRAWIATALHVVRDPGDYGVATKVEAELFTGPLPAGLLPPRLEVVLPPSQNLRNDGDDLIILEIRGLPRDVPVLPLSKTHPEGIVRVVGHPDQKPPWTEETFRILKLAPLLLYLDGELNPGASGSPVLNGSGQVVGIVYRAASRGGGEELKYVMAYRAAAIEAQLR